MPQANVLSALPTPTGAMALQTYGLSKRFGRFTALDSVSLQVRPGTVHALLGENGAGKSTLVKCLAGFHRAEQGSILTDGREQAIDNPVVARALGIGMVYQHFTLAPGMTVAENLLLAAGQAPAFINWRQQRRRLQEFLATTPFQLALERRPGDLAAGEKQKLELLKQLYLGPRLLILDEPTSVLTPQEADEVLGHVRNLARRGTCTVLLITHKFREVMAYADDVTVLRRGQAVFQGEVAQCTPALLAQAMMGQTVTDHRGADQRVTGQAPQRNAAGAAAQPQARAKFQPEAQPEPQPEPGPEPGPELELRGQPQPPSEPRPEPQNRLQPGPTPQPGVGSEFLFEVQQLDVMGDRGALAVRGLSLAVRGGEILGVAGVSGNGQRELVEALVGQRPRHAGQVRAQGQPYQGRRAENHRLCVRSLPEEPLRNACVAEMSVAQNMALRDFDRPPLQRAMRLRFAVWRERARAWIQEYGIKTRSEDAPMRSLSGGNVQRAVLARELAGDVRVLIAANPVFGLDFAAVAEIHQRLRDVRARGGAVLLVSEDLDELLTLADRIVVMSEGRIVHESRAAQAERHVLGAYMGGGHGGPAPHSAKRSATDSATRGATDGATDSASDGATDSAAPASAEASPASAGPAFVTPAQPTATRPEPAA